jgi:NitT/TauT family transport system ATP-binding protein
MGCYPLLGPCERPLLGPLRTPLSRFQAERLIRLIVDEELEDFMSEDYAEDTLKAVVAWCRFAELFVYDEADQTFSLEAA